MFSSGNKTLHKTNIIKKRNLHSNEFGSGLIVPSPAHKDVFMHPGLPSSGRPQPVTVSVYLFVCAQ